jgi:ubiquinone biosynthesis protein COQ4
MIAQLLKESYIVGRAVVRTMRDSDRTEEIHKVELDERPELSSAHLDFERMRKLPPTTLGGAYVRHLDGNKITADYQAVGTSYVEDDRMAYMMRRFRQTHDIWHTLLDLGVTPHEEVIIHAFSWGQLRLPVSALVVAFGSLKHLVLEKRWGALRHSLAESYRAGVEADPLLTVIWEDQWTSPIEQVRARYRVRPLERRWLE